jgi:hypothetical protein
MVAGHWLYPFCVKFFLASFAILSSNLLVSLVVKVCGQGGQNNPPGSLLMVFVVFFLENIQRQKFISNPVLLDAACSWLSINPVNLAYGTDRQLERK